MIDPARQVAVGVSAVRPGATVAPWTEREAAVAAAVRWNAGATEASRWCTPERAAQLGFRWCVARAGDLRSGDDLQPDTRELLHLLQEECAEAVQAASKCLRFGFNVNPFDGVNNRRALEDEIGDVVAAMLLLGPDGGIGPGVISLERVFARANEKINQLSAPDGRLRHHQVPAAPAEGDEA